MTLFSKALSGKQPEQRLSMSLYGYGFPIETGAQIQSQLTSMGTTAWLFSAIDKIATSVASTEWMLYQKDQKGDLKEQQNHPLLALWNYINPFYTQQEFLEELVEHWILVGEMWFVILRTAGGIPVEIWPIRPDRIKPVPDKDEYLAGYVYQIGAEKVPLAREDVVFIRRPNPYVPYRGIGVVQSMFDDIDSERKAARWVRNFFTNDATPGGVIEADESLSDDEFDQFVTRWRQQHQGTQNAHRVAILEKMHWKDRSMTMRDMVFDKLRTMNRNTILGALGMPLPIMGITESVNRANAEAADLIYAKYTLVPILTRLRGALNTYICPQFKPDNLYFDFEDPTPENREMDRIEAIEGYKNRVLTLNESRGRMNEGPVDGGDEFGAGHMSLTFTPKMLKTTNPLYDEETNRDETAMERNWRKRLEREAIAIGSFIEERG